MIMGYSHQQRFSLLLAATTSFLPFVVSSNIGQSCFWDSDCDSGRCDLSSLFTGLTCQVKLIEGGSCNEHSDCRSGHCGWSWTCESGAEDEIIKITSGGLRRKAVVHIPPEYACRKSMALVLDIHAMGIDPYIEGMLTGFDALADKEGFLVVRPEGYSGTSLVFDQFGLTLPRPAGKTFNAGGCCPNACIDKVDDVGFIRDLVQHVREVYAPDKGFSIDQNRIYATGMSNGAFMSHRLGCELSDIVAAIAPVAGVMTAEREQISWRSDPYECTAESVTNAPVPVLQIHAINDELVWYNGIGAGGNFPSVDESTNRWREINEVDGEQGLTSYSSECVECISYGSGRSNVTLCTMLCIVGVGHTWPGSAQPLGMPYFQATENIWEFFKNHPKD